MRIRSLIVAIVVVLAGLILANPAQAYPSMPQGVQGPYTVLKVVDGDTIHVSANGQKLKIRMIGLDTPETVDPRKPVQCFGLEASAQAKTILGGQSVYLETDPSQDTIDKYGRTLAYVWTESGRLFNLDMIADGYAFEYTYDLPYRYQADLAAQNDARTQSAGCGRRAPARNETRGQSGPGKRGTHEEDDHCRSLAARCSPAPCWEPPAPTPRCRRFPRPGSTRRAARQPRTAFSTSPRVMRTTGTKATATATASPARRTKEPA